MILDRDKTHLFPPFAGLLGHFELLLQQNMLPFYLFEGLRTWERQEVLWNQGRTTPGKIVTRAKPGHSWHQFGLAGDYVLDRSVELPGVQWCWDIKADLNADGRNDWEQMATIATSIGLEAGWNWSNPDPPHVQKTYGLTLPEARELYLAGGMEAVWARAMDWLEKQIWP